MTNQSINSLHIHPNLISCPLNRDTPTFPTLHKFLAAGYLTQTGHIPDISSILSSSLHRLSGHIALLLLRLLKLVVPAVPAVLPVLAVLALPSLLLARMQGRNRTVM